MKIEIIKENRKTISLKLLSSERAVLKVPTRLSQEKIEKFLQGKQRWLENHAKMMWQKENFSKTFDFSQYLYINGESAGKTSEIVLGFDKLDIEAKKKAIKKYYLSLFPRVEALVREIAQHSGLTFADLKPTTSGHIWGSFSSKKVMKLHWSLVILPLELQRYVIYHEFAHSVHFNHSPKFWKLVEELCPDYKALKKKLKEYSFLLMGDLNI